MLSACCTYTFFLVVFFLLVRPGGENTSVAFVVGEHWGVGSGSNQSRALLCVCAIG